VAYYRRAEQEAVSPEALRTHLQRQLPEYMVPVAYVEVVQWPLTPNGKLDRHGLPAAGVEDCPASAYEPPNGETEEMLARIWSELLEVERVGRRDNFFHLGGHSLLAVTAIERMRRAGLQVDVRCLFERPTLSTLATASGRIH
jgi:aryl carrier-like protein